MPRPVRPWFRVYVEMFPDRKLRRLTPAQRWIWVALMGAARESTKPTGLYVADGVPMTLAEIAQYADVKERDLSPALAEMQRLGMVAIDSDGVVSLPNFTHRQYESDDVTARTRAHRERSKSADVERSKERSNPVPGNDVGTRQTRATETDTDTEELLGSSPTRDLFAEFWKAYPRKTAKPNAQRAWRSAAKRADPEAIITGASRYAADPNRDDAFTAHPATWLNRDGWNDPPLPPRQGAQRRNEAPRHTGSYSHLQAATDW